MYRLNNSVSQIIANLNYIASNAHHSWEEFYSEQIIWWQTEGKAREARADKVLKCIEKEYAGDHRRDFPISYYVDCVGEEIRLYFDEFENDWDVWPI